MCSRPNQRNTYPIIEIPDIRCVICHLRQPTPDPFYRHFKDKHLPSELHCIKNQVQLVLELNDFTYRVGLCV